MPDPLSVNRGTSFNAIYDQFKPGLRGSGGDQHIRFKGEQLYTHGMSLHGFGSGAATARAAKYESGAIQVRAALERDFGAGLADRILAKVGGDTGHDLSTGITRSDLAHIKREADSMRKNAGAVVDTAIADPTSKIGQAFAASIASEFSGENLEFAREVAALKKAAPAAQADMARAIFDRFVATGSEREVNISGEQRSAVVAAFAEGAPPPGAAVFDDAAHEIRKVMVEDSAKRFVDGFRA